MDGKKNQPSKPKSLRDNLGPISLPAWLLFRAGPNAWTNRFNALQTFQVPALSGCLLPCDALPSVGHKTYKTILILESFFARATLTPIRSACA